MIEHVAWISLPDGRRLHARIWRPDGSDPVGAVLSYDPYPNQWLTRAVDGSHGKALAQAGISYVRVAIAGSGDSDGLLRDEYLASELEDGVAVIAWLAAQPWCNGRVGLRGLSWGGFNALQIAALRPPALAAVVSVCSTDDRYRDDVHYMGGNVLGYDMQLWATWAHLFFVAPPDPDVVGESWRERWLERLESIEPVIGTWLSHQRRDEYWLHGSVGVDPHSDHCARAHGRRMGGRVPRRDPALRRRARRRTPGRSSVRGATGGRTACCPVRTSTGSPARCAGGDTG